MTLTVKLDPQEQLRLKQLVEIMNAANQSELIRKLINDRFEQMQTGLTFVERRGGHPTYRLNGSVSLSEREKRKAVVNKQVAAKAARRRAKQ
jgi:hypothetical protein